MYKIFETHVFQTGVCNSNKLKIMFYKRNSSDMTIKITENVLYNVSMFKRILG